MNDLIAFLAARLDEREAAAAQGTAADPGWTLRDVAAKRAILAEHALAPGKDYCLRCADEPGPGCGTTRALAAIDSDHPDYPPPWTSEQVPS